jgi:pimeloyl-ACP methyl ester carboxylesterase
LLGDWLVREIRDDRDPAVLAGHSMGGALALIAAAQAPERVHRLVLIAPAGLPLAKPVRASLADFVRQLASGVYAVSDVLASARELARAPRATMRLARTLRRLDLSEPMARIRRAGVPVTLVGCDSDTLVTPALSRHMADLLDADYRELQLTGGHVWMLRRPERLSSLLGSVG